jgi:GTP cyclohydrolase IA
VSVAHRFDDEMPRLVERLLREVGEDPARQGLVDTPERVSRSLRFLTDGYGMEASDAVGDALFEEDYDEIVVVKDIPFYSLCEHHLLPMFGRCHIAYVPSGRVIGLSKLPRIVDAFAHRLQLQERLTREIAEAIQELTEARGVAVMMEARHLCVEMRGVEKAESETVTSCLLGVYRSDDRLRAEFMSSVQRVR